MTSVKMGLKPNGAKTYASALHAMLRVGSEAVRREGGGRAAPAASTRGRSSRRCDQVSCRSGSPARSDHGDDPDPRIKSVDRAETQAAQALAANRAHLFVFVTNRDVPYTNNVSERNLRPSVIFRKGIVTLSSNGSH